MLNCADVYQNIFSFFSLRQSFLYVEYWYRLLFFLLVLNYEPNERLDKEFYFQVLGYLNWVRLYLEIGE